MATYFKAYQLTILIPEVLGAARIREEFRSLFNHSHHSARSQASSSYLDGWTSHDTLDA